MTYPWFKFFGGEYLHDQKMLGMDGNVRSCWLTLLCYASTSERQGCIRYLTEDQLMLQAGVPLGGEEWDRTKGVLERFVARNMVSIEEGVIHITNWEKRQATYLNPAERSKRYRGKSESDVHVTRVTLEEEVEEDKDKEQYSEEFLSFWAVYPKRKGKGAAYRSWKVIPGIKKLAPLVVTSVRDHIDFDESWRKDDGQYIPHPATYLNQRRWEDEITEKKKSGPKIVDWERTESGMRPIYQKQPSSL